jgi:hypothetical protein
MLKRYKLEPKQIDRILALLTAAHSEDETKELQVDAKQVIDALSQLREIVCAIKVFAQEGHKISKELVGACYDSMLDVAVITGDSAVIPFSLAHGNPGGVVLGLASIGVGVRNLLKHASRAKEFFVSFRNSRKAADLRKKAPKKKLK